MAESRRERKRRAQQSVQYVAPDGGAAHVFRLAEKKYKRYPGQVTDYAEALDFESQSDTTAWRIALLDGHTFRGRPIYTITGHPGFLVVPRAIDDEAQMKYILHCVNDYMYGRTNITSAPSKGNVISAVDPASEEGLSRLHWATLGAHYEWTSRSYVTENRDKNFPEELISLSHDAYKSIGLEFETVNGLAGTVNYYQTYRQMCGHIDDAEGDLSLPLVSLSLGLECIYLLGGATYDIDPLAIRLRSGDLVIMSGESRRSVHGVPRIIENTFPAALRECIMKCTHENLNDRLKTYLCDVRLNVNVRSGVFGTQPHI